MPDSKYDNLAVWEYDALKAEAAKLSREAEIANRGEFFRTEESRVIYNQYMVVCREIGRRDSAVSTLLREQAETKRIVGILEHILTTRPTNPTLADVDALSHDNLISDDVVYKYGHGYRVIVSTCLDKRLKAKRSYRLEEFDLEQWCWKTLNAQAAWRNPRGEFKRLIVEEPIAQEDIDFYTRRLAEKYERHGVVKIERERM